MNNTELERDIKSSQLTARGSPLGKLVARGSIARSFDPRERLQWHPAAGVAVQRWREEYNGKRDPLRGFARRKGHAQMLESD